MNVFRITTTAATLCFSIPGCGGGDDAVAAGGAEGASAVPERVLPAPGEEPAPQALAEPWGWFETRNSPVTPFCSVLLVAPDVVMTAAVCLDDQAPSDLTVGFGEALAPADIAVKSVHILSADPRLAALVLDAPSLPAQPASLAVAKPGAKVHSVSIQHVVRGTDAGRWWTWVGAATADSDGVLVVEPSQDAPNCHADLGAPLFAASGPAVGLVVGARMGDDPCADAIEFAPVHPSDDAFDEALALSK